MPERQPPSGRVSKLATINERWIKRGEKAAAKDIAPEPRFPSFAAKR